MKKTMAILLCAVLLLTLLTGCGGASKSASADTAAQASATAGETYDSGWYETTEAITEDAVADDAAWEEADWEESEQTGTETATVDVGDKIIYSAELYLETTEFDQAIAAIGQLVTDCGGYIQSARTDGSTTYGDDGTTSVVDRYAYYTIAVPQESFEAVMEKTGTIGNVTSEYRYAENITSQYTDTAARLESLRVQEERLLAMMEETTEIESLIALEERLSDVTYEIESYQRTLDDWDRQVAYSTINLSVQEVARYTATAPVTRSFGERLADAFRSGWSSFADGLQAFAVGVVSALPALLLLAVLTIAVVLIVRSSIRRKRKKAQTAPENTQE